ncbi:molting protein mlt-4 [Anaeramoeba flamelloides]|uniref:Molting protein mlt-4 n=1 Tax=Anaeramoeba flamelloides TaxID=1746091 RepID=A0AAV7YUH5_9EUKA|nr:molting protein mlt-4 [Anaeramoeba flamelloides]
MGDNNSLFLIARDGNCEALEDLLKKGIDPNTTRYDDWTALHLATLNDNLSCVDLLLKYQANPLLKENKKRTSIHISLHSSNRCIKYLLKHVKIPTLFKKIIESDDTEYLKKYSFEKINKIKYKKLNAIHFCCIYNRPAILNEILKLGMDVDSKAIYQITGLHLCAIFNQTSCTRVMITHGADINCLNLKKETPLLITCKYGCFSHCDLLLANGADPLLQNYVNLTPLHYAVFYNSIKCIHLLFQKKKVLEMINHRKQNLIHLAIKGGSIKSLRILKKFGANFEILNANGETPFQAALTYDSKEVIKWFCRQNQFKLYKNQEMSAIHKCLLKENLEILQILLTSKKIPVNLRDKSGNTALYYSVRKQNTNASRMLLKYGAKVDITNNMGESVFDKANKINFQLLKNYKKLLPKKVKNVQIVNITSTTVTILWSIPKSFEKITNFRISINSKVQKRKLETFNNWVNVSLLNTNTKYSIKVCASNYFGNGKCSKNILITTHGPSVPSPITTLKQLNPLISKNIHFKWTLPNNNGKPIIEFEIKAVSLNGDFQEVFFSYNKNPEFDIFGLTPNLVYFISIRSRNTIGWSNWSIENIMLTK